MKFDIEKKGYKRTQVDEYVFALKNEYESKLAEQKNRIFALKNELVEKEKKVADLESKRDLISTAIINAVAKAEEIEKLSVARYREEMSQLRAFHEKWQAHYNKLLDKYPSDKELRAVSKFNADLDAILSGSSTALAELEKQFNEETQRVESKASSTKTDKKAKTPTKTRAEDAGSDSGFSLEEAWNPNEDLSDIMKELGLGDDE